MNDTNYPNQPQLFSKKTGKPSQPQGFPIQIIPDNYNIIPCDQNIDIENENRYQKLKLNSEQKMQISAFTSQIPTLLSSNVISNAYSVKFPNGLPHRLIKLKQGGFGSQIPGISGQFTGSASFTPLTTAGITMGVFSAMAIASGQYFLTEINSKLTVINSKLDKILEFLYGEKKAELLSEVAFVQNAYKQYSAIMESECQRIATISSLQEARKVAMKDIEFYLNDLESTVYSEIRSIEDVDTTYNKLLQVNNCLELAKQLYVMSNILEVYYAQNFDESYIQLLEEDIIYYFDKINSYSSSDFSIFLGKIQSLPLKKVIFDKEDKKRRAASLEKEMAGKISLLKNNYTEKHQKMVHSALNAHSKEVEYYLNSEGDIYIKK